MSNYFKPIAVFTRANLQRFFRDKTYIFFTLILPVMFLVIFGMIYGGTSATSFNLAVFNDSPTEFASQFYEDIKKDSGMNLSEPKNRAEAEESLIRGEIDAILQLPKEFGEVGSTGLPTGQLQVVYGKNSEQAGRMISAVVNAAITDINNQMSGQTPPLSVESTVLNREGLKTFDYVFAGLLGYTILSIGLMGIANILPGDKESGATKRLRATTISSSQLILSYALTFLMIGILSMSIMVALGIMVFNFDMRGSWLTFSVFTTLSTVMMLGFGLAVGGGAKNEAQASALANLVMFPMMFLSGVFFPKFLLPEFMQSIMNFVPLTPIIDGTRLIITENYGLLDLLPQLGMIGLWGVIIYFIAIRTFRWE